MKFIYTVVCAAIVSSLSVCQAVYGQFIPYSQYHNAPLLTNPAAPALTDYMQVTLQYRRSRVANYDIPSVSFLMPFYRQSDGLRYGGIGANIINQKAGPNGLYKVTGATGTFAYTLHLSKNHHIGAGISAGIINKRLDASGITTESQYNLGAYDPSLGNGENIQSNSVTRPVINAGFGWTLTDAADRQKASLGVAAYSMNQPAFDLIDNAAGDDMTYVINGEVDVLTRDRVTLSPTFRYVYQGTSAANIGARMRYALNAEDELSAGLWYKTTKALVVGGQYNYKAYIIGASMDLSIGSDRDANINNAIEIVLGWRMNRKNRVKSRSTAAPAKTPVAAHENDTTKTEEKTEEKIVPSQEEKEKVKEEDTQPADTSTKTDHQPDTTQSTVAPKPADRVEPTTAPTPAEASVSPATPPAIPFEPGSNTVPAKHDKQLEDLAALLKSHPDYRLKIMGHSARLGDRPTKDRVSYERAQAVAKILIEKGVPAQQLEVVGMGDRKPIASNKTKAGRHKNRRVEFEWSKK